MTIYNIVVWSGTFYISNGIYDQGLLNINMDLKARGKVTKQDRGLKTSFEERY